VTWHLGWHVWTSDTRWTTEPVGREQKNPRHTRPVPNKIRGQTFLIYIYIYRERERRSDIYIYIYIWNINSIYLSINKCILWYVYHRIYTDNLHIHPSICIYPIYIHILYVHLKHIYTVHTYLNIYMYVHIRKYTQTLCTRKHYMCTDIYLPYNQLLQWHKTIVCTTYRRMGCRVSLR
jgi:hypothetical protein